MVRACFAVVAVWLVGCADRRAPRVEPPPSTAPPATPPTTTSTTPPPPPAAVACAPGDTRHGSACCSHPMRGRDERSKFPGMQFLTCRGPRIGLPCKSKLDCDIACSCDASDHLSPGAGPQGPADGSRGVLGHCAGSLQIGVWMCQIDEHGKVGHTIVD
ncbi:MAG: hypothetical protein KIT31_29185 [Deltaproteobacteria bacterium]|nr:hypothetical protein [Deltaproteobacteria bacterium]